MIGCSSRPRPGLPRSTRPRSMGSASRRTTAGRRSTGLEVSDAHRLKQLEDENRRLKHLLAEEQLDNDALKTVLAKSPRRPAARREVVQKLMAHDVSQRRACRLLGIDRKTLLYERRERVDEPGLRRRLHELAWGRPRFGYRRLHVLLRREQVVVNHKRVYRLVREEKLTVRRRRRKRRAQARGRRLDAATEPNDGWAMDFVSDILAAGRRIRVESLMVTRAG